MGQVVNQRPGIIIIFNKKQDKTGIKWSDFSKSSRLKNIQKKFSYLYFYYNVSRDDFFFSFMINNTKEFFFNLSENQKL